MPRLQYSFVLVLLVNLFSFASAGQSLGSMSFPMDIGHHLTGALFRRAPPAQPQPQPADASVLVTIDTSYISSRAPPPTMFITATFIFTNANKVAVDFQKSVRDSCNTVNVEHFDCRPSATASNKVNCNTVISLAEGEHKSPNRCVEKAVENFMSGSTNLDFHYNGW